MAAWRNWRVIGPWVIGSSCATTAVWQATTVHHTGGLVLALVGVGCAAVAILTLDR